MNSRRSHSITSSARASSDGGTVEAERLGGLEIDDQLELGRLHDRQVGRLLALEDAADIDADLTIRIRDVGSVAHQSAGFGEFARMRYIAGIAWRTASSDQLHAPASEERIAADKEGVRPLAHKASQTHASISRLGAGVEDLDLHSRVARAAVSRSSSATDAFRTLDGLTSAETCGGSRHQFAQQFQLLRRSIRY